MEAGLLPRGGQRRGARRDFVEALRDLAALRDRGIITEQEFQQAKVTLFVEHRRSRDGEA